MPTWLLNQSTVLSKRFVLSKDEHICNSADLLQNNLTYAGVRHVIFENVPFQLLIRPLIRLPMTMVVYIL